MHLTMFHNVKVMMLTANEMMKSLDGYIMMLCYYEKLALLDSDIMM